MFTVGQTLYSNRAYPLIPITKHTIEEVVKVVDADGREQNLYKLSDYVVYFPENEILEGFLFESKIEK